MGMSFAEDVSEARDGDTSHNDTSEIHTTSGDPSLLEEMTEGMALSMLVFLMADLRLMSATGRVRTQFQILALDSDYLRKTSAGKLAGIGVEDTEIGREGLSPAQLMAIVLIEMRQSFNAANDPTQSTTSGVSEDFVSFVHGSRQLRADTHREEQMHTLLKAYAEMIGGDLKRKVPHIEARRSMLNLLSEDSSSSSSSSFMQEPQGIRRAFTLTQGQGRRTNNIGQSVRNFNLNLQNINDRRKELLHYASVRNAKQIEEVTDAVFTLGNACSAVRLSIENSGAPAEIVRSTRMSNRLSPEQLLQIMIAAVESRDAEKLDFMANFFEKGTISRVMVRSKARIVWFNDWYPVNDLTYAIAVDEAKQRVMVVFRGAITKHDWSKAFDSDLRLVPNPIQEDFEGKTQSVGIYSGFYEYLFRVRKDTGTTKYEEIATMAHKYGIQRVGKDYRMVVTGHSLGAALSTTFSFFASTEERFTKNGPIKMFTFGSPYIGGHEFADCFRHQEEVGKLMYARFYNHNDTVAFLPGNFAITKRGSKYLHVGIGVKIPPVPRLLTRFRKWSPKVYYVGNEGCLRSYRRGVGRNVLMNSPWIWTIPRMHSLEELQTRVAEGRLRRRNQRKDGLLKLPIEELYEQLAGIAIRKKMETLALTKYSPIDAAALSTNERSIRKVEPLMSGSFDKDETE